jgi:hypothetical protein
MKEVIYINQPETASKPVEFTHFFAPDRGWCDAIKKPQDYEKVVYIGECKDDGSVFSAYDNGYISIYKGHLNSGKY